MATRKGDGSLFEDKVMGRWVGRVELGTGPGGKRRRKTVYGATKAEAREKLKQLRRDREDDKLNVGRDWTTGEWLNWWLDNIVPGTVTPASERMYRQVVRTWVEPFIGKVPLPKLRPEHVVEMMRALERQGLSANTQGKARTILRRSLRIAERHGRVNRNVAALTDPPKLSGHKLDDSLSAEEAAKVIQAAEGDRLGALAVFVLAIGARQGEALDLRWSDLDLDAGVVSIHGTKSASSDRKVALPGFVADALKEHRRRQRNERMAAPKWADQSLVFATKIGTRIDGKNAWQWWNDLTVSAGVGKRRFHASRHTAATLMLNAGVPLEVVSKTLGHSGLAITSDIYAKVRPELQRKAADAMEALLGAGR